MNSLFSRFGLIAVLVALLLSGNAVAQQERTVNGGVVINTDMGELDSVRVINNGTFLNGLMGSRTIANIFVENGTGQNESGSNVTDTFRVTGAGSTGNNYGNTASAEVRGGTFTNYVGGTVGTFDLSAGDFFNRGRITEGTVSGGTFRNNAGASVTTLDQDAGTVHNSGTITGVVLSNVGTFNNLLGSTLGSLTMLGGTVSNASTINNLTYTSGTYGWSGNGSIGTLNLAGDVTGTNWGNVDHLRFDSNESGLVTIAGFVDDGAFGFTGLGMQGLQSVNLEDGNFDFYFAGTADQWLGSYSWESIFGTTNVDGWEQAFFRATWDDVYTDWFRGSDGWTSSNGNAIAFGIGGMTTTSAVPEPATLAIIGLGLVGLGLARRRKAA